MKNNKIISSVFLLFSAALMQAQIAIGKNSLSTLADGVTPNPSISLEFGTGFKGLVLPYVLDASTLTDAVEGTIVFDVKSKKMMYKNGINLWHDLTLDEVNDFTYNGITIPSTLGVVDNSIQINLPEKIKTPAAVIIGSNPTSVTSPGVLVLSDTNKAMVLPKMDSPHLNIVNPAPGMMVYDTKMNQLAVFNGAVWTFWKP